MTREKQQQLLQSEWEKFKERFPLLTSNSLWARLNIAIRHPDMYYLIWENGFLQGWIQCHKDHDVS